ncbi:MAG: extracellular solute-binding protein [candidate division KSB1 bacterium]|nr:extracellular solute-binding protein [candidate division KSB1 bacterium]MDZ7345775.1 extracellular solute-binding protein [candidate division KSB1 bacterium]
MRQSLVYWPAANVQEIALARQAAEEWNRLHPELPVKVQPIPESQSTEEVLLAAVVGKTTPDICSNIWPGIVGQLVRAGAVIPLDQFADFDSVITARLPEAQIEPYRYQDGRFYQMPWKTNPIMLEYNVSMLKAAGFDRPPATYSEFFAVAEQITRDLDGDGDNDRWMMAVDINVKWWLRYFDFYTFYIAASKGETLIRDRKVCFENQAAVEVFRFFQEGFRRGYFPKAHFQQDPFLAGLVAVHVTGPWNIDHLNRYKPEGFEFDYAPIPVPDGHEGPVMTYGDPKNIAIFTTCRNPKAAWQFVKLLVSKKQDLMLLQLASQIPIRRDMFEDVDFAAFFAAHPKLERFALQAPFTRGVDPDPELREIFDAISQEFEACCILGRRSPEEAVRRAAERAREILQ